MNIQEEPIRYSGKCKCGKRIVDCDCTIPEIKIEPKPTKND